MQRMQQVPCGSSNLQDLSAHTCHQACSSVNSMLGRCSAMAWGQCSTTQPILKHMLMHMAREKTRCSMQCRLRLTDWALRQCSLLCCSISAYKAGATIWLCHPRSIVLPAAIDLGLMVSSVVSTATCVAWTKHTEECIFLLNAATAFRELEQLSSTTFLCSKMPLQASSLKLRPVLDFSCSCG